MGSPVSSVIGNLVIEDTSETFADTPRLWKRYEEDTFVMIKNSKVVRVFH